MKKSVLLLSLAAACAAGLSPMLHASEYVYTESNIGQPNANSVFAFKRAGDGSLTPVAGSPFLTGGAGLAPETWVTAPLPRRGQPRTWVPHLQRRSR